LDQNDWLKTQKGVGKGIQLELKPGEMS